MAADEPLVSVILPAYNAAATISRTLDSVRAQTYTRLEIIVIDDGSGDDTAAIVARHARADARIRLLRTANHGVAAARASGLAQTSGPYVAFIDADDLWHPDKTRRQLQRLRESAPDTAFVYSPCRLIDAHDRVRFSVPCAGCEGWVFIAHLLTNFVGNGSAMLARRQAIIDAGGIDPGLRAAGMQGCEDLLLQWRMAARFPVALCRAYLVGYRVGHPSISADRARVFRARQRVGELIAAEVAGVPAAVWRWYAAANRLDRIPSLLARGEYRPAASFLLRAARLDPCGFVERLGMLITGRVRRASADPPPGRAFQQCPVDESLDARVPVLLRRRLARVARLDRAAGARVVRVPERA